MPAVLADFCREVLSEDVRIYDIIDTLLFSLRITSERLLFRASVLDNLLPHTFNSHKVDRPNGSGTRERHVLW